MRCGILGLRIALGEQRPKRSIVTMAIRYGKAWPDASRCFQGSLSRASGTVQAKTTAAVFYQSLKVASSDHATSRRLTCTRPFAKPLYQKPWMAETGCSLHPDLHTILQCRLLFPNRSSNFRSSVWSSAHWHPGTVCGVLHTIHPDARHRLTWTSHCPWSRLSDAIEHQAYTVMKPQFQI